MLSFITDQWRRQDLVRGGAQVEAPKAPMGVGAVPPPPEIFFEFLYQNGEFWCILGSN